ncbi:GCN5-related N-acetyltransferase [Alkaliphilus metalliredigens QYMF]|uniref:GCN5-related N-acetyltransferase n=1 Tax=Alkaliphilus metalliredigens (strain QYMF) TaxID=293826 RepID=A6TUF4_ALKMQ|nr:pyridoxal-phosphate dependent enzyme [Alkaliphilus metalliredigens]ABR49822.1 GCN5-related N-acetyltransferase [Alkaliphilus metalliredigens QYMF]
MNKNTIIHMVGKTPLVRAEKLEKELGISKIYLKLEGNNPSGQRIDRLAHLLIKDALSINKKIICIGSQGPLAKSLAFISQYYDINCVFVFPTNSKFSQNKLFKQDHVKVIPYGKTHFDSINYSQKLCEEEGWYNATLGMENNILNMTSLSFIADELHKQIKGEIDTVFTLMSYGFSTSGLNLGFRQLWINDEMKKIPKLYNCTINDGNVIYESFKKKSTKIIPLSAEQSQVKVTKYNKHLLNFNSSISQDALDSIYDTNGTITGITEEELLRYTKKFKEIENIKFSTENGYVIAGFMKEAEKGNLSDGTHVILLNDGRIDLDVRNVKKEESDLSVDEIVTQIDEWLMEYTDPSYEIKDALKSAFDKGFVLMAYYNNELAGITIIVHTGFESFIPTYHLGYIATKRTIKGRGIATQLLNKAIEVTDGNVSLHVERNNNRAIKLYEKMGFEKSYVRMIHKANH